MLWAKLHLKLTSNVYDINKDLLLTFQLLNYKIFEDIKTEFLGMEWADIKSYYQNILR